MEYKAAHSEDPEQAKEPYSLLWAMDQLAYKDWQKWDPARQKLWGMLNELDKLGY